MKRTPRTHTQVKPDDLLYCYLGGCVKPAKEFVQRGPNRAEPTRAPSYRAYCKDCHRARSGATPGTLLKSAGHGSRRPVLQRDPEVEHALGVLRDARGKAQGRQGYVYLIIEVKPGGGLQYGKVGYSTNPRARVAELQTGNPRPLALHCMKKGTEAVEAALHAKYIQHNVLQEWFSITRELLLEFDLDANGVPFGARTGRMSCSKPNLNTRKVTA